MIISFLGWCEEYKMNENILGESISIIIIISIKSGKISLHGVQMWAFIIDFVLLSQAHVNIGLLWVDFYLT